MCDDNEGGIHVEECMRIPLGTNFRFNLFMVIIIRLSLSQKFSPRQAGMAEEHLLIYIM